MNFSLPHEPMQLQAKLVQLAEPNRIILIRALKAEGTYAPMTISLLNSRLGYP